MAARTLAGGWRRPDGTLAVGHFARRCAALVLLLALPVAAQAALFVCTDANGRVYSADQPPPECANRPVRELRSDGSVKRVINAPMSEAQRAAEEAEAARKRAEEAERAEQIAVQREQVRRDRALLEAFSSEDEIEASRKRALADRERLIERAIKRRASIELDRKKIDAEAEFYANRDLPASVKQTYEANRQLLVSEDRVIADLRADLDRINARFDADLKRYRELMAISGGARPNRAAPPR